MVVIAVLKLKFAIGGFPNRGFAACAFAGVFHEVKISDDCNDVALAKASQNRSRLGMVTAAQPFWNFTFQRLEIISIQQRGGSQRGAGYLVLQEMQVRVVSVGGVGAAGWKLRVTRLGIQTGRIAPCHG